MDEYYSYYDTGDSAESEEVALPLAISFLLGGFLGMFGLYIFGVCKNKSHNNFIMFNTLLTIYDWIFDIIFVIWSFKTGLLFSVPSISLALLFIAIFFNSLLTLVILRREFNNNEQFRVWFQNHKAFGIFIAFCSLANVNVLHVLNCKFNYMDKCDAKLSPTAERKITHASVISLIVGDIPQFFLLTAVCSSLSRMYAIPMIGLFLNFLVIIFGFFYRIYEATIRGYEKPGVQDFIVSKKQFLEA